MPCLEKVEAEARGLKSLAEPWEKMQNLVSAAVENDNQEKAEEDKVTAETTSLRNHWVTAKGKVKLERVKEQDHSYAEMGWEAPVNQDVEQRTMADLESGPKHEAAVEIEIVGETEVVLELELELGFVSVLNL